MPAPCALDDRRLAYAARGQNRLLMCHRFEQRKRIRIVIGRQRKEFANTRMPRASPSPLLTGPSHL